MGTSRTGFGGQALVGASNHLRGPLMNIISPFQNSSVFRTINCALKSEAISGVDNHSFQWGLLNPALGASAPHLLARIKLAGIEGERHLMIDCMYVAPRGIGVRER